MTEERKIILYELQNISTKILNELNQISNQMWSEMKFLKDYHVFQTKINLTWHTATNKFLRKIDPKTVIVSDEQYCNGSPENLLKYNNFYDIINADQQGSWILKFISKKFFFLVIFTKFRFLFSSRKKIIWFKWFNKLDFDTRNSIWNLFKWKLRRTLLSLLIWNSDFLF
jgi:hypothetical protein